jgi:tRNA pseudouridine55 synthase
MREVKMTENNDSILAFYKPKGMTSFEVVRKVRHEMKLKKVGHAGTLDPLAEGLLIILTGNKTKMMESFLKMEKEYLATLRLGVVSRSHDLETELVERSTEISFSEEEISNVLGRFTGKINQVPPDFSAAWVDGKRAYHLARRGVEFELKPKSVVINKILVELYAPPILKIRVVCSSGTYIRSLTRDIGEELGCGAVLEGLVRTRIGEYRVQDAMKLEDMSVSCAA